MTKEDIEIELSRTAKINTQELITTYEWKLAAAKIEMESCQKILNYLRHKPDVTVSLKWRDEIRRCLKKRDDELTSSEIADCVAIRNDITVDRNVKLKISTTLSLMFNEGQIGRYIPNNERDYRYGESSKFKMDENGKLTELNTGI